MNNQQLALLLTQYQRALDVGLDQVCEKIPEHKVMYKPMFGNEYPTYPIVEPLFTLFINLAEDIEKLEQSTGATVESQEPAPEPPKKGKEVITFEQDHICVNGANLGVHDLLMYARLILKRVIREVDTARLYADLEEVIRTNQYLRGIEPGARMQELG